LISTVEGLLRGGPASAIGSAPPLEEAAEIPEVGIPEGVPSLDFSSSSLNRSGPAAAGVLAAPPPDLPAVELTDTYVTAPPPAPPELTAPPVSPPDFGGAAPPAAAPMPGEASRCPTSIRRRAAGAASATTREERAAEPRRSPGAVRRRGRRRSSASATRQPVPEDLPLCG
jgi:hypothetical protein